jgi:tetratricopeptide (TPR) repeat protein
MELSITVKQLTIKVKQVYYLNTLNFKAAIEKVQERINENPNDADSFYAKGFCYYKLGDKEMSNECRDKAIEIDKSYINKKYI